MGLLCGLPRLVTAVAAPPVVVLPLPKPLFEDIVSQRNRRGALLEVTNRLLQLQVDATGGEAARRPRRARRLDVQRVQASAAGVARAYPLVRADAPALSGLACLAMVEAFHGKSGVRAGRRRSPAGRAAAADTMDTLSSAAEELGYVTRLTRLAPAQLRELPLPAVIEPDAGEFAVVFAANGSRVVVGEPARRRANRSRGPNSTAPGTGARCPHAPAGARFLAPDRRRHLSGSSCRLRGRTSAALVSLAVLSLARAGPRPRRSRSSTRSSSIACSSPSTPGCFTCCCWGC